MPARGYTSTKSDKAAGRKAAPKRKVVKKAAAKKLTKKQEESVSAAIGGAATKQAVKSIKKDKTVLGGILNARRNARDIVTGAPASIVALNKALGEEAANQIGGLVNRKGGPAPRKKPGIKPIKEGIQRDDPVYALGEALVKKVKGDDKGAKKALDRAGDNAYERPIDAAAYVAGGAGVAGRGATVAKHGKGGTAVARARPSRRTAGDGESTRQKVREERKRASDDVRARKAGETPVARPPAGREKPQTYSANAATRTAQKARENRKAKKGLDPFKATPRQAKRINKRRQDEITRNTKSGSLAREQTHAQEGHENRKALKKDAVKMAAAQLIANDRVRRGSGQADLEALARTAEKRGARSNAKTIRKITPRTLNDPKVQAVAARQKAGLLESEERLAREGYFEEHGEYPTNPQLVAWMQPHLARGDIVQRSAGDPVPEREGDSTPPTPPKPKPAPAAEKPRLAEPTTPRESKVVGRTDEPKVVKKLDTAEDEPTRSRKAKLGKRRWEESGESKLDYEHRLAMKRRRIRDSGEARDADAGDPKGKTQDEIKLAFSERSLSRVAGEIEALRYAARQTAMHSPSSARRKRRSGKAVLPHLDNERMRELEAKKRDLVKNVEALKAKVALGAVPKATPGKPLPAVRKLTEKEQSRRDNASRNDLTPAAREIISEQRAREKLLLTPERAAARVEEANRLGIEPDPRDVARAKGEDPSAVGSTGADIKADADGLVAGNVLRGDGDDVSPEQQGEDKPAEDGVEHDSPIMDEPVADAPEELVEVAEQAAKKEAAAPRQRSVPVKAQKDGYYWTTGPKAGQRVTEADISGEQGAFIRGLDAPPQVKSDLRTPKAGHGYSAEDAILGDLLEDRVTKTRIQRERTIMLTRLARFVEQDFAEQVGGKSRFEHARAVELASRMEGMGTLRVTKDDSIIVPREVAIRWKKQMTPPGRIEGSGRLITRQFVRTVLPFSVGWQVGNIADLYMRLVTSDARFAVPGLAGQSGRDLVAGVEAAMRGMDEPHLADEMVQALKGHFGARSTVEPLTVAGVFRDAQWAEAVTSWRQLQAVKLVADPVKMATDKALQAGVKAEGAMVRRASGVAMENYAKALGYELRDHQALAEKLAGEFKADPAKLLEFQRRTLEITGDYVTRGPGTKTAQRLFVPFIQWVKAANKFVFHTLPVGHPYKTAMMLYAAAITEEERRNLGLSGYITPSEARKLGLKSPQEGYLAGGLPLPGGKTLPVSPLTSFGEAARIIEGVENLAEGDNVLRDSKTLLSPVVPFVQGPVRAGVDYGPVVASSKAIEAFVPGTKQVRRVREGERPHPRSTIYKPIGTGGTSATDRILAGMTAPVGREFPESAKQRRERPGGDIEPNPNRSRAEQVKVGEFFEYKYKGPGGKIVTRRIRRRAD